MTTNYASYLGDGVYADFDGYCITLATDDPVRVVVHLEPPVMAALKAYEERLISLLAKQKEA